MQHYAVARRFKSKARQGGWVQGQGFRGEIALHCQGGRFFSLRTEASGALVSLPVGAAEAMSPMNSAAGDSSTTVPPTALPQIGDVSEQSLLKAELQKMRLSEQRRCKT